MATKKAVLETTPPEFLEPVAEPKKPTSLKFFVGLTSGILLTLVGLKLSSFTLVKSTSNLAQVTPAPNSQALAKTSDILPNNYRLGVSFGDVIVKMVKSGAIDKNKFIQLYEERSTANDSIKKLLDTPSNEEIVINQENAAVLLNLLWPLGISNKSLVLSEGPMAVQPNDPKDQKGNYASTGGWTLGTKSGGNLLNSLSLLKLSPDQEELVKKIASNIYRPCCGNSTAFPDCNHGAAMLGFIELAVAQGLSEEQIYQKALVLNSYWFPQNYAEIATLMKAKRNLAWKDVNPREVLGADYSSGQGAAKVNNELQTLGLVPKVKGGGGCGV